MIPKIKGGMQWSRILCDCFLRNENAKSDVKNDPVRRCSLEIMVVLLLCFTLITFLVMLFVILLPMPLILLYFESNRYSDLS